MSCAMNLERDEALSPQASASNPPMSKTSIHDHNPEDDDLVPRDRRSVNPVFERTNEHVPLDSVPEGEFYSVFESRRAASRFGEIIHEVEDEFASTVPLNNMAACKSFIIKNPNLLGEVDLDDKYLIPAVQALAMGTEASRLSAWSYMEKCTVIICIKSYLSRDKGSFLDALIKNDRSAKEFMRIKFGAVKNDCEKRAQHKTSEPFNRQSSQKSSSREADNITKHVSALTLDGSRVPQLVGYQTSSSQDLGWRKDAPDAKPKGAGRPTNAMEYASYGANLSRRKESQGAVLKGMERELEHEVDDETTEPTDLRLARRHNLIEHWQPELGPVDDVPEEDLGGATPQAGAQPPSVASIDHRFQSLPASGWKWFRIGCVFAIKLYSWDSRDDEDSSELDCRDKHGRRVFIKVRRHVVVNTRHGHCHVVPILTYGGQGLHKPGLSVSNIKAHARIHMKNRDPRWLDDSRGREPRTNKKDMVVQPTSDNALPLEEESRICFERTHTVDYNERIIKIGYITDECLPYLVQYWEQETREKIDHTRQPRKKEDGHDSRASGPRRK